MKLIKSLVLILIIIFNLSGMNSHADTQNEKLLKAVISNRFYRIRKLVTSGADVNAKTKGLLPLVEAANRRNFRITKYLLNKGAKVNLGDKDGDSALIVAALRGSLGIVKLLLKHGADINRANEKGRTALIYAVYGKHKHVVKYLLEKGADVLHKDKTGETATTMAIRRKSVSCLKLVMKYGAAITRKHIILAAKLYCKPYKGNGFLFDDLQKKYPAFSKTLHGYYSIFKNPNYGKEVKIVHNKISLDGKRRAVAYSNGVIKIFDLKTGKFIKAFGNFRNLDFKMGWKFLIKFHFFNKDSLFIAKKGNLIVRDVKVYFYYKKKNLYSSHNLYSWQQYNFGILNIKTGKYETFKTGKKDFVFISNTGKYYIYEYANHVLPYHYFDISKYKGKTTLIWPVFKSYYGNYSNIKQKFGNSKIIFTGFGFSPNDKFFVAVSFEFLAIFDTINGTLLKYKRFKDSKNYIKAIEFLNNNTTVKVTYKDKATRWLKFR